MKYDRDEVRRLEQELEEEARGNNRFVRSEVVSAMPNPPEHKTLTSVHPDARKIAAELSRSVDGGARPDLKRELEICVSSLSTPYNYFASRHDAQSEQCATAVGETIEALEKLAEGLATDGGAREMEQAAQAYVDTLDSFRKYGIHTVELEQAEKALRAAVDRRKR